MDHKTVAVLAAAAEALHASARAHKRAADAHRKQARRLYTALSLVERECDRLGIHLEITQTPGRESQ